MSPFLSASSESAADWLMQALLSSFLQVALTCHPLPPYRFAVFCFCKRVFTLSISECSFLRSSIFIHVSSVIHTSLFLSIFSQHCHACVDVPLLFRSVSSFSTLGTKISKRFCSDNFYSFLFSSFNFSTP